MLVRNNKHFFLYLSILKNSMKTLKNAVFIIALLSSFTAQSQCGYDTLSVNIKHIPCFDDNSGEINLIVPNVNASFAWNGPSGFSATSIPINSLFAGEYILTISELGNFGDTICTETDTFTVNETNDIEATFLWEGFCSIDDSADVVINVTGGTPFNSGEPYTYQLLNSSFITVSTNDSAFNLPVGAYTLSVADKNGCTPKYPQDTLLAAVESMNPFMSSVGVICKDDDRGEVRVFVQEGTPPFTFNWGEDVLSQENDALPVDSFSSINGLFPGVYSVEITDDMGCVIKDSIEVKSNPAICITVYKAFSPNDDDIHEFWEIENIQLYPQALVVVYDRNGRQVFKRRNYINAEDVAFGGKDLNGQPLPSGTYYYVIDLENEDDVFKGVLTIVR